MAFFSLLLVFFPFLIGVGIVTAALYIFTWLMVIASPLLLLFGILLMRYANRHDLFARYENSETPWIRILAKILHVILWGEIICSAVVFSVCLWLLLFVF